MGHAERLSLPLDMSGEESVVRGEQVSEVNRQPTSFRGRCALLLLVAMSVSGYGVLFYFGQVFLVR